MQDEETKELLCEIRDAMIAHSSKYEKYLMEFDKRVDSAEKESSDNASRYWVTLFAVIFSAVLAAMKVASEFAQ